MTETQILVMIVGTIIPFFVVIGSGFFMIHKYGPKKKLPKDS